MTIKKYKYTKQEVESIEYDPPQRTIFFFIFGYREAFAVFPRFADWMLTNGQKDEVVQGYDIIRVDPEKKRIESTYTPMNKIEEYYHSSQKKDGWLHYMWYELVNGLEERQIRTKEQFMADFDSCLSLGYSLLDIKNPIKKS